MTECDIWGKFFCQSLLEKRDLGTEKREMLSKNGICPKNLGIEVENLEIAPKLWD